MNIILVKLVHCSCDVVVAYWSKHLHLFFAAQENFKCVSCVASVGLQDLANQVNQILVSN